MVTSLTNNDMSSVDDFSLQLGSVHPFGAQLHTHGCNFSIYAPDAEDVFICLFDQAENLLVQIALTQRLQSKWYGFITHVTQYHSYGIRVRPKRHRQTHPQSSIDKLLIDPYAKALTRPLNWDRTLYEGDSHKMIPKGKILPMDISAPLMPLGTPDQKRIIYETHIKGLTALHPDVPQAHKGKYLGACDSHVIKHLQRLGVTSVQFLPLMAFMPEPFITRKGLTNYWGYNPVNFFAAEPRYATNDAVSECKYMINEYRQAGIEVILDVVFNHTCESGYDGPVISFKGLFESHAYLIEQNDESDELQYLNFSGCGNTLKVSDTYVMTMMIDALRYWVNEMGVSGFRFDLASVLGREVYDFKSTATFFKVLKQDPVLKHAVMIAEPWDIGPGGYQLGHYPDYWLEVNDKYRDAVRGFWRGDEGLKGEFATRLMGSRDVFRKNVRPMHASINHVTYHDGFTLQDIVSYEQKHNLANLEDNRDGHNHNITRNYGIEGDSQDADILRIREKQKRNLFASLMLSQGTPHILGGDEISRTQQGNNNAYCQDNEINWYDWHLDARKQSFLDYCAYVIALRSAHPILQQMCFADERYDNQKNVSIVDWYRRDGSHKTDIDWVNQEHHCFALHIVGDETTGDKKVGDKTQSTNNPSDMGENDSSDQQEWLFCFNSLGESRDFTVPLLSGGDKWQCMLDTALEDTSEYAQQEILPLFNMPARSIRLFKK
jgi:isoamylase